jgi:hypothetical protein
MNTRLIPYEDICPACGSADLVIDDAPSADGRTQIVFACLDCGQAWPLACPTGQPAAGGGED